jgi:hypothetical protein
LTAECFNQDSTSAWKWTFSALNAIVNSEVLPQIKSIVQFHNDLKQTQTKSSFLTCSFDGSLPHFLKMINHANTSSDELLEIRGNFRRMCCSSAECKNAEEIQCKPINGQKPPVCSKCGNPMRLDCVLLDELIDSRNEATIPSMKKMILRADCLILIGNQWHDEEELSNCIYSHAMQNKPIIEFAEQSLLRAGKIKFVAGNPMHTVPIFADTFHRIGLNQSQSQSQNIGAFSKVERVKPKKILKRVSNCDIVFPAWYTNRGYVISPPSFNKNTIEDIGKPLNMFKAVELNDMFCQNITNMRSTRTNKMRIKPLEQRYATQLHKVPSQPIATARISNSKLRLILLSKKNKGFLSNTHKKIM